MFCHLHIHNEFSVLDGFGTAEQYAKRASQMGFKYLALTNHGNIDGLIQWQEACEKYSVEPVMGCEMYIVKDARVREKGSKSYHITLLIKNQSGFRNINKLLTYANLEGFYYRPRIDYKTLLNHLDGLFVMTGCASSFLNDEYFEDATNFLRKLIRKVDRGNIALEIMPHDMKEQQEHNEKCFEFHLQTGIPLVATNDCHYIHSRDWEVQEVLLAIQTKALWNDPKRFKFKIKNLHLRSHKQMLRAFEKHSRLSKQEIDYALRNTINVAKKCCKFRIRKSKVRLPQIAIPDGIDEAQALLNMCVDGRKGKKLFKKKYAERMIEELKLINDKGFTRYFLIVKDWLDWCKKEGIMYGPGRGSVGGSLVAYLLDITNVDPMIYGTLFNRFIAEDRVDFPDIDLDFEDIKGDMVRGYLENKYGAGKVVGITTAMRMKMRNSIRDVARVFEISNVEVAEVSKAIDKLSFRQAKESFETIDKVLAERHVDGTTDAIKRFDKYHPDIFKYARKLEGQVRGYGQHAAGLILSPVDLMRGSKGNLVRRKDNLLINWDMKDVEKLGLLKIDKLNLNTLTVLSEAKKLIGDKIVFEDIDLEDESLFKMINEGNTTGLFQVQTAFMTGICKEIEIDKFSHLCAAIALGRPGPYDSGMTASYIKRKRRGVWRKGHRIWEEITKDTYGVIVYQEQVIEAVRRLADMSYTESDKIRRIIGKKRDVKYFEQYKKSFIEGCLKKKTLTKREAIEFWNGLEKHARYSFNKSHSVGYAMLTVWTAYCKHYYPAEFIASSLSYMGDKPEQKHGLLEEAVRLGMDLVLPKWGKSEGFNWAVKGKELYCPFIEVKGFGAKTVDKLMSSSKLASRKKAKGFFEIDQKKPEPKTKIAKTLTAIGAYDESRIPPQGAQDYFDFQLTGDFGKMRPKLFKLHDGDLTSVDFKDAEQCKIYRVGIVRKKSYRSRTVLDCTDCDLRRECTKPVPNSRGKYNMAVVLEAPGFLEDKKGKPAIGKAGSLLWKELDKYGLKRSMFHVTNVNKCYPKKSKTPSKEQIVTCSQWINKELQAIDCKITLVCGANAMFYFTGNKEGITKLSKEGKVHWNEARGMWNIFCVHPSAVLRNSRQNREPFERGIAAFAEVVERFT
ncbi:MAG: DNA polymerase III subunit alpha [Thermodesulfovibrionia bacterium]|nr:DNA polymerase III subunit alpha [Thermodesulfovibrionia bacterium]